ncbi:TolC family protein [Roseateles chitinivorans]|uniref:TolC family protein n=1 Tax=Roseateles chitinivorans TaxID=2917965 RepID=UPI003D6742E6
MNFQTNSRPFRLANIHTTARWKYSFAALALICVPAHADDEPRAAVAGALDIPAAAATASTPPPANLVRWGAAMDDFLGGALSADPSLERARASIAAAEAGVSAAKWQFGPSPSFSRQLATGTSRYVNVLSVQQPLYTGGLLSANLNAARTTLRSSELELRAAQRQLKLRIVQTWADWTKAHGRIDRLEALRAEHQQLLEMIRRRTEAGVATTADGALAASRLSAVMAELAQAQLEEALQRDRLQRLARRPVEAPLLTALDGDLPTPPSLNQVLDRIQLSPEMAIARANVDLSRDELSKAKAVLLPTVSLRLDRQSGAYKDDRIGFVFQAGLPGGLSALSGLNAARSRIAAAEAAVAGTEQDQWSNYQLEYTRYAAAVASLRNAALTASTGDEVLASYRRQFYAGKRAWLDLLNMVREAHATRQAQADAATDERAGLYRLTLLLDNGPAAD